MAKCFCGNEMARLDWKHQWVCHRCGRTKPLYECMTNADRIRSMTDEELAELLLCNLCESIGFDECPQNDEFFDINNIKNVCGNCVREWLKTEAGCE